ncbi:hypothetical protein HPB51_028724 [Rhipicephalus microplus]|uniref:Uncharacterized protein n=1 Tax=Rhipicephalus microplus TaxID=6941 RepID=A0A9J6CWI9_RHIMP|nr:hypothetical protein HPB51_028724 [Rhipicephalus microplus]
MFVRARQQHQPESFGSTTPRRHSSIPTARSTSGGTSGLEDHASKRQKVDDATAEEILMRISNGDISDGDFSDDELEAENEENIPANGQVTASTTTAALPARPDATVSSNAPAASTKAEFKWVKKDFAPRLEDHASKRQKVDDATAEEILMRISNGDISDGDFSDDELEAENEENIPANGQVTASTTTAALPARPDATVSSNAPAASTKAEFKWVKKDFAPSDVDCHYNPEVASTCQQPLVYFSKYFTEQIFEDLAEFTNRYVLQRDGAV